MTTELTTIVGAVLEISECLTADEARGLRLLMAMRERQRNLAATLLGLSDAEARALRPAIERERARRQARRLGSNCERSFTMPPSVEAPAAELSGGVAGASSVRPV